MSIEHDITQATNQRDALIILGRALDRLEAAVLEKAIQPADPWASPLDWQPAGAVADIKGGQMVQVGVVGELLALDRERNIAAVQAAIDAATDPQDIEALTARLRLLKDTGGSIDALPEGNRVKVESDGSTGTVDIPPASEERQRARRAWSYDKGLSGFIPTLTPEEAADAYSKGGPMWLYLSNRKAVMAMPYEWRVQMVEDIQLDSVLQAQEVGRDILKQTASTDRGITAQAIDGLSASRGLR